MISQLLAAAGGAATALILSQNEEMSDAKKAMVLGAYGAGTTVGLLLPFSRKQESEADEIGALYMARAGYNPNESVALWERFAAYKASNNASKLRGLLSTHPTDPSRIAGLKAFMPRAMQEYRP